MARRLALQDDLFAYTYTGLTAAGNAFIDGFTEQACLASVTFWEQSMNHWLQTGERLGRGEPIHAAEWR